MTRLPSFDPAHPQTSRWDPAAPPFSFRYDGQGSATLLAGWERSETTAPAEGGQQRQFRYHDPASGLTVTATLRTFDDSPALDWVLELANEGAEDTPILEDILPLDLNVPWEAREPGRLPQDYVKVYLHHANGSTASPDDFLPHTTQLFPGFPCTRLTLKPEGGRSSDGVLPFMNLQGPGGGLVLAVGWSGQWQACFERSAEGVRVCAGMERTHLRLYPGERIRTPRILLLPWQGDDPFRGNNLLRRVLLAHYCPRLDGALVIPPVAHMTMSTFHATRVASEAGELEALAKAAELGAEAYWVDALWFGSGGMWWEEVGNWVIRPDVFPRGLKPIGDAAHQAGMKFILWFEPERVRRGTPIAREHPEYLLESAQDPDNRLLNLGLPEVRAYLVEALSRIITESGVDIYRQDFNFRPLPYWQAADAPDRVGMTEIRHIEGLYALWDELRRRHPGLAIDNCASGGRRIDLETISRSFPLWRSDFSDVIGPGYGRTLQIGDQSQTCGLSRWVPLHTAAVWTFSPYDFRSAMSSGVVIYCNIRTPDFPAEDARRAIAELKRLRPLFLGDFYPLLALTVAPHDWCAYQFDRPDLGQGCAVFLRRHASPFPTLQDCALRAIDPQATYEVGLATTFDEPPYRRMSGAELAHLTITIPEPCGSVLLLYRRVA